MGLYQYRYVAQFTIQAILENLLYSTYSLDLEHKTSVADSYLNNSDPAQFFVVSDPRFFQLGSGFYVDVKIQNFFF